MMCLASMCSVGDVLTALDDVHGFNVSVGDVLNALDDVPGFNVFCGGCIE